MEENDPEPTPNLALRGARDDKNLTQKEVAERIDVASTTYSRWERGVQTPGPIERSKLSELFGKRPGELGILPKKRRRKLPAFSTGFVDETTELIGRDDEIREICTKLRRPNVHLLTLTGPPGIGKTDIARKVTENLRKDFGENHHFIPLVDISDYERVLPTIAHRLGIVDIKGKPLLERLQTYLHNRHMFLTLDNFEQVRPAGKELVALLAVCPKVKVLVTSLVPLDVRGEHVHPVPGLDDPFARQLFTHSVEAAGHDLTLTKKIASTIAQICDFVNGNPGLIILAAGTSLAYPPKDILKRLEEKPEDVLEALHTMFTRLYALLKPDEQRLFQRLLVFRGGFTQDAAEDICTIPNEPPLNVFQDIRMLKQKNFVVEASAAKSGITRFKIPEAYRAYALRLKDVQDIEETDAIKQQHYSHFFKIARDSQQELRGPKQQVSRTRLEEDLDNLRAALDWCLEKNMKEEGLRLANALLWFWYLNGYWKEGADKLKQLDEHTNVAIPTDVNAQALYSAGYLAFYLADYRQAQRYLEQSMALYKDTNEKKGFAYAQVMYAMALGPQTPEDEMRMYTLLEESVGILRSLDDTWGTAWSLIFFAYTVRQDPKRARSLFQESQRLFEEVGDQHGIAWSYLNQGDAVWFERDYEAAEEYYEQARNRMQTVDDRQGYAWALGSLGNIMLLKAYYKQTASLYADSLDRSWKLEDKLGIHGCFIGTTELLRQVGLRKEAVRLLGATNALYQNLLSHALLRPLIIPPPENAYDAIKALLRAELDEETFTKERRKGECMSENDAVPYALKYLNRLSRMK